MPYHPIPCQSYHIASNMFATYYVKPWSHDWLIVAGAYPGFCSMKRLGVFLLPPVQNTSLSQVIPPQFVRFHQMICHFLLYSWVNRDTVRVMCLVQEHNTVSSVRAQARATLGDECIDHQATTPPLATYYVEFLL